jgi:hypothetical protein
MGGGRTLAVAPVTWTKGRHASPPHLIYEVWFRDQSESEKYRTSPRPFLVAVAIPEFAGFRQVLEVQSTGKRLVTKASRRMLFGALMGNLVTARGHRQKSAARKERIAYQRRTIHF